jgi:hypothetical protein
MSRFLRKFCPAMGALYLLSMPFSCQDAPNLVGPRGMDEQSDGGNVRDSISAVGSPESRNRIASKAGGGGSRTDAGADRVSDKSQGECDPNDTSSLDKCQGTGACCTKAGNCGFLFLGACWEMPAVDAGATSSRDGGSRTDNEIPSRRDRGQSETDSGM